VSFRLPWTFSFWLDETITGWLITLPLAQLIESSLRFQAQSPLYFVIIKGWSEIVGSSEAALRSFSALCTLASLALTIKIARTLNLPNATLWIVLTFFSLEEVTRTALSARPYGLALFAATLSTYSFLHWKHSDSIKWSVLYVAALILTFYAHYLFVGVLILHILWLLLSPPINPVLKIRSYSILLSITFLFFIPGLAHMLWWRTSFRSAFHWALPTIEEIIRSPFPRHLLVYLLCALAMARCIAPFNQPPLYKKEFLISMIWWLLPTLLLVLLSLVTRSPLLISRYGVWRVGGIALVVALLSTKLSPRAHVAALVTWIFLGTTLEAQRVWHEEGWRQAAQELRERSSALPLFLSSGFKESEDQHFIHNAENHRYLGAPLAQYAPMVPYIVAPALTESPESLRQLKDTLRHALSTHEALFFVLLEQRGHSRETILEAAAERSGGEIRERHYFGLVSLIKIMKKNEKALASLMETSSDDLKHHHG